MIRAEPADRLEHLLDVVVSWPGLTMDQAALEVGVSPKSVSTYAGFCRRRGWLRAGAVPRTVDIGHMTIADWWASDGLVKRREREIYQVVCSRYDLNLPCRLGDIGPHGFRYDETRMAYRRLRAVGAFQPVDTLWPTELGELLAAPRLDPDLLPALSAG